MATQTYTDGVTLTAAAEFNKFDTAAYAALSGVAGTNTITATGPANLTLVATNPPLWFIPAATNTGATTINITPSGGAALGAKNVFFNGAACVGGEIVINVPLTVVYDGTQYNIIGSGRVASASVAAHATTSNVWTAQETVLTGIAVTFTDIADAPYVGAVAWVKQNAAHIWTDGAVFDVQGGANYTAAAGDWIRVYATTVSTFELTIFRALAMSQITNALGADVSITDTSSYFDGPTIAQGTSGVWFVSGSVTVNSLVGVVAFAKLWDGTTVIASAYATYSATTAVISLSGYISSPAGNLRISVKETNGGTRAIAFNASGNSKDSVISAIRIG